jgi:hypothetical protein
MPKQISAVVGVSVTTSTCPTGASITSSASLRFNTSPNPEPVVREFGRVLRPAPSQNSLTREPTVTVWVMVQ